MKNEILSQYIHLLKQDSDNPYLYKTENSFKRDTDKRLIIILTGLTGSGKDAVLRHLKKDETCRHAVTGTSRGRRFDHIPEYREEVEKVLNENLSTEDYVQKYEEFLKAGKIIEKEREYEHVWLRKRRKEESIEEYMEAESLIECDEHYGNIYGLPISSLEDALADESKITIVRTDIRGMESLQKSLEPYGQTISIALVGDSWGQARQSLLNRDDNMSEEKIKSRLDQDVKDIPKYVEIPNYLIVNTREQVNLNGEVISGFQNTIGIVKTLIS